ncbi:MAG: TRAP transporter small permease [Spirochaetia bacterium]|nr:TRAP transporter small permease [Spirochaetia bacterium]
MREQSSLKKAGMFFVNLIELYIPIATFVVLFLSFMAQIVARYFFKPLIWPEELSLMCFVWTALLGGLYAKRMNSHVAFSMVYDLAKPETQRWMRLAGNLLMAVALIIVYVPSWEYVQFMAYKKSDALRIPMNWAYFPFMIFLTDMIVRVVIDIVKDLKKPAGGGEK